MALSAQVQPHLAGTEPATEPVVPGSRDQRGDLSVAQRPPGGPPRSGVVVAARGDLAAVLGEHGADRLDPEHPTVLVDEVDKNPRGRSSSAAKKADADFKISFARRSSAFSFFSSRISASSSLVFPGRCPPSISARRTHLRRVSGEPIPSLSAIERIASNSEGYSAFDSATSRTARSRNSMRILRGTCHELHPSNE